MEGFVIFYFGNYIAGFGMLNFCEKVGIDNGRMMNVDKIWFI